MTSSKHNPFLKTFSIALVITSIRITTFPQFFWCGPALIIAEVISSYIHCRLRRMFVCQAIKTPAMTRLRLYFKLLFKSCTSSASGEGARVTLKQAYSQGFSKRNFKYLLPSHTLPPPPRILSGGCPPNAFGGLCELLCAQIGASLTPVRCLDTRRGRKMGTAG
jgi:hypothetical protein